MANAKIETVTKTVEKKVEERFYTLTLSEEEAKSLRALVANVTGSRSTYNRHTSAVFGALANAGVPGVGFASRFRLDTLYGFIRGKDIS